MNLTSDAPVLVEPGANLTFTYSVAWHPTTTPFARRFERYLDYSFFEHKARAGLPAAARALHCPSCCMT